MKNVCRICLCSPKQLQPLFDGTQLSEKIKIISSVVIEENDGFPNSVCDDCIINVNTCYNFRLVVINSDEELRRRANESNKVIKTDEETFVLTSEIIIKGEEIDLDDLEQIDDAEESEVVEERVIKVEEVVSEEPEIKEYTCKKCDFVTDNFKLYSKHNRLRKHKELTRICSVCGKMIPSSNMASHLKSHETTPIECDICGKVCKNSESLRHHKRLHNGPKICEYCGKSFNHRGNYHVHVKKHHKGGMKRFNCSYCEKVFFYKQKLKKHIQAHTGERPYICEFCQKGFSSTDALKTHKRQHTNEKPYQCKLCSAAFKQRVLLRNHLKTKHPGQEYEF